MSEIFLIPPEVLQNFSDPPNLIIKVAELVSVFEAEIDHPLGLLKVKAGNLRGTLIVVRIKLQNSHHINIFYMTDKKFDWQGIRIQNRWNMKHYFGVFNIGLVMTYQANKLDKFRLITEN